MEALEALDSAEAGGEEDARAASGQGAQPREGKAELKEDNFISPAKRRRRGFRFLQPEAGPKEEDPEEGPDDEASFGLQDAVDAGASEEAGKRCPGCDRCPITGREWHNSGLLIVWAAPNQRGHWCKDCHTCWRTCYRAEHNLTLFSKYLRNPANKAAWQLRLVAFLSLVYEGVERIGREKVEERVRLLQFVSKLTGAAITPSVVVPLAAAVEEQKGATLEPSRLVTVTGGDGTRSVGVLRPTLQQEPRACEIPGLQRVGVAHCISTDSEQDLELLKSHFGVDVAIRPGDEKQPQQPSTQLARAAASKLTSKVQTMSREILPLLQTFQEPFWDAMKESKFTAPVQKMSTAQTEAATLGDGAALAIAKDWAGGLTAGKQVLKLHREWAKTKYKDEKLLSMSACLPQFLKFLKEQLAGARRISWKAPERD